MYMRLTREQFDALLRDNQLVLSLIGMSNIGKSYWSKKLSEIGFDHFSCDDAIESRLAPVLQELGYHGIEDVSRWMGQPYDDRFSVNQGQYLSYEQEALEYFFTSRQHGTLRNTILDTTGSVVHTGEPMREKLKKHSLVIYIEATESMKEEMFRRYIAEPKPVVFGDFFIPKEGETVFQTLGRSYRALLNERESLYTQCADVRISCRQIQDNMNVHELLSLIRQSL